ncbi:MAG: hypothetical protein KME15_06510 [Drouetiella hepatica Uher 2000/2452]|jgi:hypothetical protein|uniref:Uncharacterized protein n=1 Tax=Drouetiella hepatica Uher 2000/2452 TaxID=904376 RepID=A0A951Q8P2_9CYAN|nr:hypothetical protein [Drouetiella hepatica Uher 2000/2452]
MNLILFIAALVVSFLVFAFLVRVFKAAIGTAIAVAVIVLVLQLAFGIAPTQLLQEIRNLFDRLWQMVR